MGSIEGELFQSWRGLRTSGEDERLVRGEVVIDDEIQADGGVFLSEGDLEQVFCPGSRVNQLGLVAADEKGRSAVSLEDLMEVQRLVWATAA